MKEAPLGKKVNYSFKYDPSLLFPIPRIMSREKSDLPTKPSFHGVDIWNCYELSWLNSKGKPEIAIARLFFSDLCACFKAAKTSGLNTVFACMQSLLTKFITFFVEIAFIPLYTPP